MKTPKLHGKIVEEIMPNASIEDLKIKILSDRQKKAAEKARNKKPKSDFQVILDRIKAGELRKMRFDSDEDFKVMSRKISYDNWITKKKAAERGIENWREFEFFTDKEKLTIYIQRNKREDS